MATLTYDHILMAYRLMRFNDPAGIQTWQRVVAGAWTTPAIPSRSDGSGYDVFQLTGHYPLPGSVGDRCAAMVGQPAYPGADQRVATVQARAQEFEAEMAGLNDDMRRTAVASVTDTLVGHGFGQVEIESLVGAR